MNAIIETGGKQYRVKEGDIIEVELLHLEENAAVVFDKVLFVNDGKSALVGTPTVKGFVVKGELLGETKGPKITSMKYKPSHNQYRRFGHRQKYNKVKVTAIARV